MKTNRRRLARLAIVALIALTAGVFTALPGNLAPQGFVASAGCTKAGRASFDPDGVPRCDCTIVESSGNCSCIVTCPPGGGGGDFETEQGGAS